MLQIGAHQISFELVAKLNHCLLITAVILTSKTHAQSGLEGDVVLAKSSEETSFFRNVRDITYNKIDFILTSS